MRKIPTPAQIAAIRKSCGMTQEQFASAIGVTLSNINRWELGKSKPSPLSQRAIEALKRPA